jgi:hypothetical protein
MTDPMTFRGWQGAVGWTGVVVLNLPLPLMLGSAVTHRDGYLGIGLAVLLCWVAGLFVCSQSSRHGPVIIRGGGWVALSQVFPIAQFVAGVGGVLFWEVVSGSGLPGAHGPVAVLGGFVVTLTTAAPLLFFAFVFGGGLGLLRAPPATEQTADYS